ncbi:unnamed protein product [Bursaphelenchus xylophilus]|uniref:(pine wood nematode) hypothetical protein n=1 Tax=Bursaphelenchus xylophilus TaxID=6326 RepID=A0A1I7RW67_BURXY|nr:unnamed protein product [Bursaphelenchus xylophilus]CAG9095201.1 unnamed protein product [Bursaphelenchus xylophilus]
MSLYISPPFYGLASVDSKSLQFLAAARFCATELKVVHCRKNSDSPTGVIPSFVDGSEQITDFVEFVEHLRRQHSDIQLDSELSDKDKVLLEGFDALIKVGLLPALEQLFWIDDFNFSSLASRMIAKTTAWPYYFFYLNTKRAEARKIVERTGKKPEQLELDAIKTLNLLSAKLGNSKYFNGTRPSSLDALIFGYLAPLFKLPMANDRVQLQLKALPNLAVFLESISSIYCPVADEGLGAVKEYKNLVIEVEKAKKRVEKEKMEKRMREREKEQQESSNSTNIAVFIAFSLTATVLFGLHTGIIQIPKVIQDDDDE